MSIWNPALKFGFALILPTLYQYAGFQAFCLCETFINLLGLLIFALIARTILTDETARARQPQQNADAEQDGSSDNAVHISLRKVLSP
eukprot:CAMPEP_0202705258 /NCGR_PEP_ID=MMETSP1385-20130828/17843_1 /ASSEMBLY_ACC=CAM_ASM_000861 /TAXON_ID=933848 /ORGANISM="Elphidium margaritaceum" /LENGTH=87 /DNA_ID=CAMNT_0049363457 /DNA_START=217 /DNA_END=477 /DNA_ORIENTATION=-